MDTVRRIKSEGWKARSIALCLLLFLLPSCSSRLFKDPLASWIEDCEAMHTRDECVTLFLSEAEVANLFADPPPEYTSFTITDPSYLGVYQGLINNRTGQGTITAPNYLDTWQIQVK